MAGTDGLCAAALVGVFVRRAVFTEKASAFKLGIVVVRFGNGVAQRNRDVSFH